MAVSLVKEVDMTAGKDMLNSTVQVDDYRKPSSTPNLFPAQNITFATNPELLSFFESRQWSTVMLDEFNRQVRKAFAQKQEANLGLELLRDAVLAGDIKQACQVWLCIDHEPALYVAGTLEKDFEIPDSDAVPRLRDFQNIDLDDYIGFNNVSTEEFDRVDEVIDYICLADSVHCTPRNEDMKLMGYLLLGNPVDVLKYYRTHHQPRQIAGRVSTGPSFGAQDEPTEASAVAHMERQGGISLAVNEGIRRQYVQERKAARKLQRKRVRALVLYEASMVGQAKGNFDPDYEPNSPTFNLEHSAQTENAFRVDTIGTEWDHAARLGEIPNTVAQRLTTSTALAHPYIDRRSGQQGVAGGRVARFEISKKEKEEFYRRYMNMFHPKHPGARQKIEPLAVNSGAQNTKLTDKPTFHGLQNPSERAAAEQKVAELKERLTMLRSKEANYRKEEARPGELAYLKGKTRHAERLMAILQAKIAVYNGTMTVEELLEGFGEGRRGQAERNASVDFLTRGLGEL
ncbi:MAG: hypothetical protein M1835_006502 [Candelina submexicana]|nr:MAG: hypothetical protein M1835_006502 [Candelina submexicana]